MVTEHPAMLAQALMTAYGLLASLLLAAPWLAIVGMHMSH
jgi:hypothetical protein